MINQAVNHTPASTFTPAGDTVFAALLGLAAKVKGQAQGGDVAAAILAALSSFAEEKGHSADASKGSKGGKGSGGAAWKSRKGRQVTSLWSGLGLVVPYDKKTEVGYR